MIWIGSPSLESTQLNIGHEKQFLFLIFFATNYCLTGRSCCTESNFFIECLVFYQNCRDARDRKLWDWCLEFEFGFGCVRVLLEFDFDLHLILI